MKKFIATILFFIFLPQAILATGFNYQIITTKNSYQLKILFNNNENTFNTIEGKILFATPISNQTKIVTGNSVIDFWIDKPTINNNELIFSGMTPGGINNEQGELMTLEINKKEDLNNLRIKQSYGTYYLNDGTGTGVNFTTGEEDILINQEIIETPIVTDNFPPETFFPKIINDPEIFSGKYFIVFDTKDKGSGLDYFRVAETKTIKRDAQGLISPSRESLWKKASSPYVLKDQNLSSYVLVEAVDQTGNRRLAIIYPQNPKQSNAKYYISGIIVLLLLSLIIFFGIKQKTKWKKSKQNL